MKIKIQTKTNKNLSTLILSAVFIFFLFFSCSYLFAQETATDVTTDDFHLKDAADKNTPRLNLGIKARSLTDMERKEAFLQESGLIITQVTGDSPADNAGLYKDDIILFENNRLVQGTRPLREAMKKISEGKEITLSVINNNSVKEVCFSPEGFDRSSNAPSLGIKVKKTGSSFYNPGLLVTSVRKDTPASSSGIAQGDIILFIDGKAVYTPADVRNSLSYKKPGDSLMVSVLREKIRSDFMIFFDLKKEEPEKNKRSKPVESKINGTLKTVKPEPSPVIIESIKEEKLREKADPPGQLPSIHVGAN